MNLPQAGHLCHRTRQYSSLSDSRSYVLSSGWKLVRQCGHFTFRLPLPTFAPATTRVQRFDRGPIRVECTDRGAFSAASERVHTCTLRAAVIELLLDGIFVRGWNREVGGDTLQKYRSPTLRRHYGRQGGSRWPSLRPAFCLRNNPNILSASLLRHGKVIPSVPRQLHAAS
jgi:hypothetical protein